MPVHILSAQDLWTLTVLSGFDVSDVSPLRALDAWIDEFSNDKAYSASVKRLYKAHYLWKRKDGKLRVNLSILPALLVLMQPEEITLFFSLKYIQSSENYFLKRSNTIVHYTPSLDFKIHSFSYPWNLTLMEKWLENEMRLRVTKDSDVYFQLSLRPHEFLTLVAIQQILREKYKKLGKLSLKDSLVDYDDLLIAFRNTPKFIMHQELNELADEFIKKEDLIYYAVESLKEKGLIRSVNKNELVYTDISKELFDPGLIVDFGIAYYKSKRSQRPKEYDIIYHEDKVILFNIERKNIKLRVLDARRAIRFLRRTVFPRVKHKFSSK